MSLALSRWEWIARRLLVLGDYGYDTQLMGRRVSEPNFLDDNWLREWYGDAVSSYVQDELDAIDLILSAQSGQQTAAPSLPAQETTS